MSIKIAGKGFLEEERGQLVGTPLKLVIAIVIGVAVLGVLLQMMNMTGVITPHYFDVVVNGAGVEENSGHFVSGKRARYLKVTVRDKDTGRALEGAIVEVKGGGVNDAMVTDGEGVASNFKGRFEITEAYVTVGVTVTKEGYVKWHNTFLCKQV